MTRLRSAIVLALWFWFTYLGVSVSVALLDMMRRIPRAGWGTYLSRDFGMGLSWLIPMSAVAAAAFGCAVATGNRVLRQRNARPVGSGWFPVTSAVAALALELTGAPTVIWHVTDRLFGPESMWNIATIPAGLAVLGASIAAMGVAGVRWRGQPRVAGSALPN